MLTFSQIPYERLDIAAAVPNVQKLTKRLQSAASAEEAIAAVLEYRAFMQNAELAFVLGEVRYTQDTRDGFYTAEQEYYAENKPQLAEATTAFCSAMLVSPFREQLSKRFGKSALLNCELREKSINKAALPLLSEESALCIEYQKLQGGMRVEFEGQSYSVPQMRPFMQSADRKVRKRAHEAFGAAYEQNAPAFEGVYDKLVNVRQRIALALGFESFTPVGYLRMQRISYDRDMVQRFREQVKTELVPLITKLKLRQAECLDLDKLKYYDDSVLSAAGNPTPVNRDEALYEDGLSLYRNMRPETKEMIDKMSAMQTFDLFSREGKMTGGYCTEIPTFEAPFIFANFSGTADDVNTFTHEGGHAFACCQIAKNKPELLEVAYPSLETCECHSMSMEFLCWDGLSRFYGADTERAKVIHLLDSLFFIPYGCMVDEFQHIVYDAPTLTPAQRNAAWQQLEKEYRPYMDYENAPFFSEGRVWEKQLHIFTDPFYYIDYCLAQTVSLQFMQLMTEQGFEAAWEKYMLLVNNSGMVTFTDTLAAAGLKSPFEAGVFTEVIRAVSAYLDENMGLL